MKKVDHENLNKFYGLCYDGPVFMSIWRYCSRGSLKDIIEQGTTTFDSFFMTAMIRDVCEVGIYAQKLRQQTLLLLLLLGERVDGKLVATPHPAVTCRLRQNYLRQFLITSKVNGVIQHLLQFSIASTDICVNF
jgi:hypothetical protein